ncbi:MAG: glycosyltransferase, partial [Patescibacteria group bacterium]
YPPHVRGGAEIVASSVAEVLSLRGHEIFVLTRGTYKNFPCNIFRHERLPFFLKLFWHGFDLLNPCSDAVIRRVIREQKPDLFLTHNLKGIGVNLSRAIQRRGVFQIHTLHDLQLTCPSGLLMYGEEKSFLNRSFFRRWYECVAMFAIGKPNVIISPSKFLIDAYHKRGMFLDSDVRVLPNPARDSFFVAELKDQTVVVSHPLRFLFAGQLESHK